jgi:magnesium transporter
MLTCTRYRDGSSMAEPIEADSVRDVLSRSDGSERIWIDVVDPAPEDLEALRDALRLHPLTVEDMQHRRQRPKVELFSDYVFVVVRPVAVGPDQELVEREVHLVAGKGYFATLRYSPLFDTSEVVARWERQPEFHAHGSAFALYLFLDEVVDDYLSIVERFEDAADDLEDSVFSEEEWAEEGPGVQQRLFRVKRDVVHLRRFATPLRQVLDVVQEQPEFVPGPLAPYYRDVSDHVIRVTELADNVRDLITTLLEVRLGQAANRLNEVTKQISAWAAIILIPTLIAGIYGMNFRHMPELDWVIGYPVALGIMSLSSFTLWRLFKRRGWL